MADRTSAEIKAELEGTKAPAKKGKLRLELIEALERELASVAKGAMSIIDVPAAMGACADAPTASAAPAGFRSEAALIDQIVTRIGAEAKPGVRQAFVYNSIRQAVNTRRVLLEIAEVNLDGSVDLPPWPSNRDRETGEILPDAPEAKPSEPVKFESEAEMEARLAHEKDARIAEALAAAGQGGRTVSEDERKIVAAGLGGGMPSL